MAEEAGVKIGIHPDDLPWPELAGVPRNRMALAYTIGDMKALIRQANQV